MNGRTAARIAPIDGSAALKMEASGSETRRPRRAEAPRRPRGPQTAHTAARRQAEPEPQQRRRIAPTFLIGVLAVAAVVILTLFSYAQLVMVNDQVVGLRSQLNQLQSDQTKLQAEYELAYDLQEIETEMIGSGQMNKIQSWQTYTLELSEPDAVVYFQESTWKGDLKDMVRQALLTVKEYFTEPPHQ